MQKAAKVLVFVACLTPFAWLVTRALTGRLGINPVEDLELTTGIWALRFLVFTLLVTPVRRLTGWNRVIQYRRMLGLFTFFYASLHFAIYIGVDQFFAFGFIVKDVVKRPFITMGFTAFVLMIPLAITSTKGWIRRLGRRWQMLHRLIYVSAVCAAIHYLWKVKVMIGSPVYYAAAIALSCSRSGCFMADTRRQVREPTAWLTAYRMLFLRSGLRPGDTVLVQGAGGGVATALIALGHAGGFRVWATSRDETKRQRALEIGADQVFEPGARLPERVDAVMETVGQATWSHSLKALKPGGRVVVCGATSGANPPADLNRVFFLQLSIIGSTMGTRDELAALADLMVTTGLRPLVDSTHNLRDARSAFERLASGNVFGKIVLLNGPER